MHPLSFLFFPRFLLAHVFGGTRVYLHVLEDEAACKQKKWEENGLTFYISYL
jgi:hypothetical protein